MKILIACDSYKGSLSAQEVCTCIKNGIKSVSPLSDVECVPLADGGEGTVQCFYENCGGEIKKASVNNIFFEPIDAEFLILNQTTAVIETAAASGITTVDKNRLNPLNASSYGTGELIKAAVDNGAENIILGLGSSATNDGGMGVLSALGIDFIDENDNALLPIGKNMIKVRKIKIRKDFENYKNVKFTLACDVENPFFGETGAAYIFAGQKGANINEIKELDQGLSNLACVFYQCYGVDLQLLKGSGAAGGIAGGLYSMFECKIKSGFSVISETANFTEKVVNADFIITGEGRTDMQTAFGKLPKRVCDLALAHNKPCILLSGDISDDIIPAQMGFYKAYKIKSKDITIKYAIENANFLLHEKSKEIAKGLISN